MVLAGPTHASYWSFESGRRRDGPKSAVEEWQMGGWRERKGPTCVRLRVLDLGVEDGVGLKARRST